MGTHMDAGANLRSSLDYDAFARAGEGAGEASSRGGSKHHHSGWLLKRYQTGGPEVTWQRRWFYLLDDRL
jgi:hypothetical protein